LKATGARPRREWRTGLEALSPRELRVVQLAAEGRTNREIAYQLYVTLKTIEGHLARAYTKLGIERRQQLSKFFDREKTRVPTLKRRILLSATLLARIPQSEGGSNDNDPARGFRKRDRHFQLP